MKQAVCALIFDINGKILTVSRKNDHNDIGLPGGKVDDNETLEDAVKREVLEETGHTVKVLNNLYTGIDGEFNVTTFWCILDTIVSFKKPDNTETGIVLIQDYNKLLTNSSFKDYNLNLFKSINLIN